MPECAVAFAAEKVKAVAHIEFSMKLAKLQVSRGAYFLSEHPAHASSGELPCIREVMKMTGVETVVGDMCMYGLTTLSEDRKSMVPAKKPTPFMGNGHYILNELSTRCDKTHPHQLLVGGWASKAQEYSYELCRAMCRGLAKQKRYDRSGKACVWA